ncbi:MAG TPA: 3-carboxy-cis,cis-muconate cycloisomerase [Candidatus Binataceae bacterium]|nr:3-carboxy-cis,cis-muconate cycloisomerase [Candidatus Binataceae bacterium]
MILGNLFCTEAMRRIFGDENRIAIYLDIEVALARTEAHLGIIPADAAEAIAAHAKIESIDMDKLRERTEIAGSPIIPVVEQLTARCGDYGGYVHWGATTQDIMDTATAIQMRAALQIVEGDLRAISAALAKLARRYRDTPMAGRSMLQHAVPITFGLKAAEVLAAIERHRTRLKELQPRALVGQFGGAVGTLASLGTRGLEVQRELMRELQLGEPEIAWHTHRDAIAEVGGFLALMTGTLAKFATDIKLMMQTEVGEASEPAEPGRGASSTMPQKRNPVACNFILACAAVVRQNASALIEAMVQDHERASGPWMVEWIALPEVFMAASGALFHARNLTEGLHIDEKRMRENLDATGGLISSEAVTMALAPHLGRDRAHQLVAEISRRAIEEKRPFLDLLATNATVSKHLDRAALERVLDPANYLGLAREMVEKALRQAASNDPRSQ